MIWSTYLLEEAFDDSSKWTVATDCIGTRTGLRGQLHRCNLAELVDHLWYPTSDAKGKVLDPSRPDKVTTVWDIDYNDLDTLTGQQAARGIDSVHTQIPERYANSSLCCHSQYRHN